MINGNKKCGSSLAGRRGEKNRLPNKRESEKARNRSTSAKWAGNKGKSSAHLRVKWTVDNINRGPLPVVREGGKISSDTFCPPRVSHRLVLLPHAALPRFPSYLSYLLSFARLRIAGEYFERNFPRRGLAGTPKEIS